MKKKSNLFGIIVLFLCSIIWGSAFVAQKNASTIGALLYSGIRFLIGAIIVLPFAIFLTKKECKKENTKINWKMLIIASLLSGLFLGLATWTQQVGINNSTVSKAGFITGLYTVLVPIFSLIIFRTKYGLNIYIAVLLALSGLYLLSCGNGIENIALGDIYLIVCAFCFTFQILLVGFFAKKVNPISLSVGQMSVCGVGCIILSFIFERNTIQNVIDNLSPILYAGIMSCGLAYTFQIVGQKYCSNDTVASLIMSLESTFSCIFGLIILHETLNIKEISGCILMFLSIFISQIDFKMIKSSLKQNKDKNKPQKEEINIIETNKEESV